MRSQSQLRNDKYIMSESLFSSDSTSPSSSDNMSIMLCGNMSLECHLGSILPQIHPNHALLLVQAHGIQASGPFVKLFLERLHVLNVHTGMPLKMEDASKFFGCHRDSSSFEPQTSTTRQ